MMKMERDVGWGVVVAAVFLLPGFIGCTATLEKGSPPGDEKVAVAAPETDAATRPDETAPAGPDPALSAYAAEAAGATSTAPVPEVVVADDTPLEAELRLHEVALEERDGRQAVVLHLSRAPDHVQHFPLDGPNRIVLDLEGPVTGGARVDSHAVGAADVARLRVGTHAGKLRVVVDLAGGLPAYEVEEEGRAVVLLLPAAEPVDQTVFLAPGVLPADLRQSAAAPAPSDAEAEADAGTGSDEIVPAAVVAEAPAPVVADVPTPMMPVVADVPPPAASDATAASAPASSWESDWSAPEAPIAPVAPAYVLAIQETGSSVTTAPGGVYSGQRISLDFKDADIQNVLRILADVSGLNIITTEDVAGRLTIRLMDVPWDQALAAILKAQGLDMVRDGNIVRISTVEKLKQERDAQRAADEAQKQAEPLLVRYVRVNYAKADEDLVKKVQEVLTERGTATWDERTNTIVIRDISRGVASAEELITQFDTQTPQVLIEANIVEATESFSRDLGVQWGYTYQASPEVGNAPGKNFPGRIGAGGILAGGDNSPASAVPFIADFPAASVAPGAGAAYDFLLGSLDGAHSLNARLTALERQGKGKVISRPRVVTLNNVPAKIESLEILRVKLPSTGTVISTGAGGAAGTAQNATEQIRTGIVLEVTPQVSSDGFIFLDVYAKSSALISPQQSQAPSPDDIPNELSREAESHVLIEDGETFVLGGVFRNTINKDDQGVPFLSSIPVLGWAFKNQRDIDNRQELLVFVTPRAVRARGTENLASLPSAETLWQNRLDP